MAREPTAARSWSSRDRRDRDPGAARPQPSAGPSRARRARPGGLATRPRLLAASALALGIGIAAPTALVATPAGAAPRPAVAAPHADAAPAITSAAGVTLQPGKAATFTVTTTGSPTPDLSESGQLPPGLSFKPNGDGTATISGTPPSSASGTYGITVTASNGVGSPAVQHLVLSFSAAPAITSAAGVTLQPGKAATFTVTAIGSPTPDLSESGQLPPGISFHENGDGTATISGTPPSSASGTYGITVTASNGVGSPAVQHLVLSFAGAAPAITTPASLSLAPGADVDFTIRASGSPAPSLGLSGQLPAGLSFHDDGNGTATISGRTPSNASGTYHVTVTATNGVGSAAVQQLVLTMSSGPKVTSAATDVVRPGQYGVFTITVTGSPTPTLALSGGLPSGLVFHENGNGTATISGRPASNASGTYHVTVTATNGVGSAAVQQLSIELAAQPAITSSSSFTVQDGKSVSLELTATGSPTPTLHESGALPAGLSFHGGSDGTATITGTPDAGVSGDFHVHISATNGVGQQASQTLTITAQLGAASMRGIGYWYTTTHGEVVFKGAARPIEPKTPQDARDITTMAATPSRQGYYLVSAFGGVFDYGNARFYGSIAHLHLQTRTVAFAVTAADRGYYLVTRAGNVFSFGDARYYGSVAARRVPPIAAFGITPDDGGYWLVTTEGNIYNFGDAHFYGSIAGRHLRTAAVTAFSPSPSGHGYWLATTRGRVVNFGDAGYFGSVLSRRVPPVVALRPTKDGKGYWLVTRRGNVYNLGDARYYGSSAHVPLAGNVTGLAIDF